MPKGAKIRILLAKVGLDGHDRGIKVVAQALRDAGMEVIYTGLHQTPEQIVRVAIQEDVDVVGMSFLSGAQMTVIPKFMKLARDNGLQDTLIIAGGFIDDEEIPELERVGVAKIFRDHDHTGSIVQFIREKVGQQK